ncbi:MAG: penicillin-binding protein 2 [bacterium]
MTQLRDHSIEAYRRAFLISLFGLVTAFTVLLLWLGYLQIWKAETFRLLSESNRIRLEKIPAPRGKILDATRAVLADTRPCFDVAAIAEEIQDYPSLEEGLRAISPLSPDELGEEIQRLKKGIPFRSHVLWKDTTWEVMAFVEANRTRMPGVLIQVNQTRNYLEGDLLSPVVGYMGEISRKEMEAASDGLYQAGDWIGKSGIEKQWESYLRGRDGGSQVEVDARGRQMRSLAKKLPLPGKNLVLSIDGRLQQEAKAAMGDQAGVVLAMDPRDGSILCYVSQPSFDPNLFIKGITPEQWKSFREDPRHPLTDKAIQGAYPPGSTFKIVMAVAALEEGVISPTEKLFCGGSYRLGVRAFRCWKPEGHGWMDLHQALVESCDCYFYQVGQRLGINRIHKYATLFGLGQPTRIGLDDEKAGLVPNPEWKKKRFGHPWYEGETLVVSIGQGAVLVTPMQMLRMISAVANAGTLWSPRLVQGVENPDGKLYLDNRPDRKSTLDLSQTNLELVRTSLRDVVESGRGTGKRARLGFVEVAGKTGTAQVVHQQDPKGSRFLPVEKRDHAWFVCYAPAQAPEIAMVVLAEHAGHGGEIAAPVARRVLQRYFSLTGRGIAEQPVELLSSQATPEAGR